MKFILDGLKRRLPSNPTIESAEKILEEARGSTEITSIGGGSTIDIGKYVAWKLNIPHTAIPTTAGTGSEVTKFAVFIKDGKKISFEDNELIPDNYNLEPERVVSLPKYQTASTGLDALSQAIESFWSPISTEESRLYSVRAVRLVMASLWFSYNDLENELFRSMMLEAANYSGKAINITRTSICHAISYPLTIHYDLPHGIACAYTLSFFMKYFNFKYVNYLEVESLILSLNARPTINLDKELVIKEALESSRSQNTPRPITREIILEALK